MKLTSMDALARVVAMHSTVQQLAAARIVPPEVRELVAAQTACLGAIVTDLQQLAAHSARQGDDGK